MKVKLNLKSKGGKMFKINKFFQKTRVAIPFGSCFHAILEMVKKRNHVTLKNGMVLSIQASENHYCSPKNNFGPYTHVEVMGNLHAVFEEHHDCWDVFARVPVDLLEEFIEKNGGIDEEKTYAYNG